MQESDLSLSSKHQLFFYVQWVKLTLSLIVIIASYVYLDLGRFDFYVPSLAGMILSTAILGLVLIKYFKSHFTIATHLITSLDLAAFLGGIYISKFAYNSLFFYLGAFVVSTYFFTSFKFAFVHLVISFVAIVVWMKTDIFMKNELIVNIDYLHPFFISTTINLLMIFLFFHYNEKIKIEYNNKLLRADEDGQRAMSFPLESPSPIFELYNNNEFRACNRIARELILSAKDKEILKLIDFAKFVFQQKRKDSTILAIGQSEFIVNAIFIHDKVNIYLTDATELIHTRKLAEQREQHVKAIIDATPGFVSWVDRDLRYLGVNKQMRDFFGVDESVFVGKKIGEFVSGTASEVADLTKKVFANADIDTISKEVNLDYKNYTHWFYLTIKKYNNNKNAIVVSIDITDLKNTQKQLQEEQARSEANAKLAAFGEMSASIAHEINNPMTVIAGVNYQLKSSFTKGTLSDEKFEHLLSKLQYGVDRVTKIINSVKNLAREGSNDEFEWSALSEIVDDSLVLLSKKCLLHNIDLQVPEVNGLGLECQRVQISQVLVILINNAIDAVESLSEKWIKITVEELPDHILISITDSGAGIPKELALKIFEPFFTTKGVGKGTGLGLSLAHKIIQNHQGNFSLDSSSWNTKFDLLLPKKHKKLVT